MESLAVLLSLPSCIELFQGTLKITKSFESNIVASATLNCVAKTWVLMSL